MGKRYRWARPGDINAFFGLMLDNMSDLVILAGTLIGVFGMPADVVLYRMVPGSAVGVLFGDLCYSWMAFRLARRTGRDDVTAMPLGLDTPSTFGLCFGMIGPLFLATHDAMLTWRVSTAVLVCMGVVKLMASFVGPWVRRALPRASLLGSIAAIAALLIAFLPTFKVLADPLVGLTSLGIVILALICRRRLPFGVPGALAAVLVGTALHYGLRHAGWGVGPGIAEASGAAQALRFAAPLPTLEFVRGLARGLAFLPLAVPFALMTVAGGIDVTESAHAAGDEYDTRSVLLVEAFATLLAGVCGGVVQSTPYIGHPAYKDMGGRSAYTLATALFIGLGGMLGYLSFFVRLLPEAAVAPILLFIGVEILAQAFEATPTRHYRAIAFAFAPCVAYLLQIELGTVLANVGKSAADLTGAAASTWQLAGLLGNGFILTSMLWAGAVAYAIDGRTRTAAAIFLACGVLTLFGFIHSPRAGGEIFWPWAPQSPWTPLLAAGYGLLGVLFALHPQEPPPAVEWVPYGD